MRLDAVGVRGRYRRRRQKGGFEESFHAEVDAEIEALVGPGPGTVCDLSFEAIETAARQQALKVAGRAVEQRLNADLTDYVGHSCPCDCGKDARYVGRRFKTFTTVLGGMTLGRAYYHCDPCQTGFYPRDRALGLQDTSFSVATTRMGGLAAAMVSFAESSELMRELAGVPIGPKQVERVAEALGREIAHDERVVVESASPVAPTMYLGMDGTGIPMRASEVNGRKGKQPDGSAKTREVKLVTVWSAEGRDEKGIPVRSPTLRPSRAPPAAIPTMWRRSSHKELIVRHGVVALTRLNAVSYLATVHYGSGILPTNNSRAPFRSWTFTMPKNICRMSPRRSTPRAV